MYSEKGLRGNFWQLPYLESLICKFITVNLWNWMQRTYLLPQPCCCLEYICKRDVIFQNLSLGEIFERTCTKAINRILMPFIITNYCTYTWKILWAKFKVKVCFVHALHCSIITKHLTKPWIYSTSKITWQAY